MPASRQPERRRHHRRQPLIDSAWSGNKVGDLWLGGKVNLLGSNDKPFAVAARAQVKVPTGSGVTNQTSSGVADYQFDAIVSGHRSMFDLSGFVGVIVRGNPNGYTLTNGLRWGVGASFPQARLHGFTFTAELVGEHYMNASITAPQVHFAADGSIAPATTFLKDPVYVNLGATWFAGNGFFVGVGGAWNMTMADRDEATLFNGTKPFTSNGFADRSGFQVRVGFAPASKKAAPPPAAATSSAAAATTTSSASATAATAATTTAPATAAAESAADG
jgi:hypothetical protein